MGTVLLPHPAQVTAEQPWHDHFAACSTCQEAPVDAYACGEGQRLHQDAVYAAQEAHAKALRAGHTVKMPMVELPVETWRIWHRLLTHPSMAQLGDASPLPGIDVSNYQGRPNFDQAAAGNWYIISKATEGTGYVDPQFVRNWNETHRVGRVPGAYHFSRPDLGNSPEAEADFFLSVTGAEPGAILAHDAESAGGSNGWCQRWKDRLASRTGYLAAFYSYLSWIKTRGIGSGSSLGDSWLWLAWPESNGGLPAQPPWGSVAMQQYGIGGVNGITGQVDLDRFFGNLDQLRMLTVGGGDDMFSDQDRQLLSDVHQGMGALVSIVPGQAPPLAFETRDMIGVVGQKLDAVIAKLGDIQTALAAKGDGSGSLDLAPVVDELKGLRGTFKDDFTVAVKGVSPDPAPTPTPTPVPSPVPPAGGATPAPQPAPRRPFEWPAKGGT